jgi:hypothetical protein
MKPWQIASFILLCILNVVCFPAPVLAQNAQTIPPTVATVLVKISVLFDNMLSYWVSGNTLTDPQGVELVWAIRQIIITAVDLFVALLP